MRRNANWKTAAFFYNVLNNCDVVDIGVAQALAPQEPETPSRIVKEKKRKTKRTMSGYNCFMKQCSKTKPFQQCLQEKGWSNLSNEQKAQYNELAKTGCD